MADCRIVNEGVAASVKNIEEISNSYRSDGQAFIDALTSAISAMEGETKDALQKFFTTDVQKFVTEDIPTALQGMAELLEANRQNFEDVDRQIAESISGGQ